MSEQLKAEIASHQLFSELLAAHMACLRVVTPVGQQPVIDYQMTSRDLLLRPSLSCNQELNQFLDSYISILSSLEEHLKKHVLSLMQEAIMASAVIQRDLFNLTGATMVEETEAPMTDEEQDLQTESEQEIFEKSASGQDLTDFGSIIPTGFERSMMERVRTELKTELKQNFKPRIENVREEILRKRRAGKLPADTSVLKKWWEQHSRWPYPTEEDKAMLVEKTGLKLKQINNWFINHRKRHWRDNCMHETNSSPNSKGSQLARFYGSDVI